MIGLSGQLVQSHVRVEKKRELGDLSEADDVKGQARKPDYAQDHHADVGNKMYHLNIQYFVSLHVVDSVYLTI